MMRIEIHGENITLKRYEKSFAPLLFEAATESRQNADFARWMPWCHAEYKLEEAESFVATTEENWQDATQFGYAILDAQTNEFLGGIGLNKPNLEHKFYNLGYWTRTSKQNRGTASAATKILAKAAFEDLPELNRLEIVVAIENIPSQKAAEKSGATREGILRKRLMVGGKPHDAVMFSFVREDFED